LEKELRRQKAEFRELSAILDTAMDGIAVLDSQGQILSLNRSGEALFGYDQNEVAGEHFTRLIAPESRALANAYFEGLKAQGAASLLNQGREIVGLARQGGTIPVFMTLGRIGASPGAGEERAARFCTLLRDLTHWKKAERELEEARKEAERASALKSDFLARVSHEIRTPLNAILGFAEVMMDERFGAIGNQRYKDYLSDIHASGTLVMSLVNDLLDLSKIEAGKMDFDFASIDANRIVSECVSIMQPQASRERVALRLSLSPALPNILADERSLRQIVLNLLSNAVKFNRPGGQVIVATALADAGSAVIRIRDSGVGMPEAGIGEAFEPFRRLVTATPSRGTGLGLPLTKALAEANHASLTIKSKEHEGTLVEVVFPAARILAE
ncbi:MAG TPA: ATP-binding protein, partial [Methylocella sp.]